MIKWLYDLLSPNDDFARPAMQIYDRTGVLRVTVKQNGEITVHLDDEQELKF